MEAKWQTCYYVTAEFLESLIEFDVSIFGMFAITVSSANSKFVEIHESRFVRVCITSAYTRSGFAIEYSHQIDSMNFCL